MTHEELIQIRALKREAEHIRERLDNQQLTHGQWVADTVKDYRSGLPHTVKIEGYDESAYWELRRQLEENLRVTLQKINEMETWLKGIEDAQTRELIRMYYWDAKTQEEISEELGVERETVNRRMKRFWEARKKES